MANDSREITLGVGQAHELEMAMNRVGGWNSALVKLLSTGDKLAELRDVLLGKSEIKEAEPVIDCDANPFVPNGWTVEEHIKGGMLKWTKSLIALFFADGQKNGKCIVGNELRKVLKDQKVLNANLLDFLYKHPKFIPEEWKGKCVFFWGTIYRNSDGYLYVRYLFWNGDRWDWDYYWLGSFWNDVRNPAAVRAS